jgi:hypothetical protein
MIRRAAFAVPLLVAAAAFGNDTPPPCGLDEGSRV